MEPIHLYEGIQGSCIISSNFRFENNFNEIIYNANLFKRDIITKYFKNYLKFMFYNKTNDNYLSNSYNIMNTEDSLKQNIIMVNQKILLLDSYVCTLFY